MKQLYPILMGVLLLCTIHPIFSQELSQENSSPAKESSFGMAIGLRASSFGPGGEIIAAVTPKIHLRLGGSYFSFAYQQTSDALNITGDNTLTLGSVSLIANWQFLKSLYLSAGAIYNMNKNNLVGYSTESFKIGAITVSPEQIGELSYTIKSGMPVAPYIGLGIGRTISANGVVSFAIEGGIVYQGSPKVELTATGMLSPTASDEQRQLLEHNVASMTIYPMVAAQLSFRIF
ncbi:MAG: hypothetical protein KKD74_01070 [Bacteroidetes bacterium]|nr:hypothetical protein [Bacteroidota bacterium]